jgi:hypothetical protein
MLSKKELLKTPEYWVEDLQNQLFREVSAYMKTNKLNRTELAKEWGVSKGYITQVLSGECNFSLKKLVELSLKMQKAPVVEYVSTHDMYEMDKISLMVNEQVNKPLLMNYAGNKMVGVTNCQTLKVEFSNISATSTVAKADSADAA